MDRVKQLIGAGSNVILDSRRLDKYGRALGSVRVNGTDDIAMALLAEGLVLPV
jgi:endonuclease YncB( thermonuclease family)